MKKYYDILYEQLKKTNFLFNKSKNIVWRKNFQKYYDILNWRCQLIEDIKAEYNYNILNILLINSKKIYLLAQNFDLSKNIDNLKSGIYFLVLGCLLDYLIDEGNEQQRKIAKKKLSWSYCGEYFEKDINAKECDCIDYLFQLLGQRFQEIKKMDLVKYKSLIQILKQAIDSELSVTDTFVPVTEGLIKNKSILFIVLAVNLSLYDKEHEKEVEMLAYKIGEMFSIIDDLCDYEEDVEHGQKNIVYEIYSSTHMSYEIIIQEQLEKLTFLMNEVKEYVNSEVYALILAEIQEWAMSNQYLRERVWLDNG